METENLSTNDNTKKHKMFISFNAPVILGFALLSLLVLGLDMITKGESTRSFFSVYRSSAKSFATYVRIFGHVLGHANWSHFINNMMMILVLGPLLEEKYGHQDILFVILVTAFITGIVHVVFSPGSSLLGASGVVFAFILLSSFTSFKSGTIPITFILVTVIYIGDQIYQAFYVSDNVSNMTHIVGGLVGAACGFVFNKMAQSDKKA